ncbi:alkaline phosphatase family protein [Buchananella felis]|uniref:alkaline phosphatase family protein n=1 Tax=Buchananella felis TaxID=3231492 RepID=UPI0035277775
MSELFARRPAGQPVAGMDDAAAPATSLERGAPSFALGDVLPAAARAVGVDLPGADQLPGAGAVAAALGELGRAEAAIVVMIDGLGSQQLGKYSGHVPFLRNVARRATLTTCAPSTTAAALTLLGTGAAGGSTGMLGYTVRAQAPEVAGAAAPPGEVLNLLTFADSAVAPQDYQDQPTHFERYRGATGRGLPSIGLARFAGSGLTLAALRGSDHHGQNIMAERGRTAARLVRQGERLIYLYFGEVDKAGHYYGWGSPQWLRELENVDRVLANLSAQAPQALLLITADHGMINSGSADHVFVTPAMRRDLECMAGEPRAVHAYAAAGRAAELERCWREELGENAWVLGRHEAVELGLFGQVSARRLPLLGDVIAFARGNTTIHAEVGARTTTMVGVHGSLTRAELEVPLLAVDPR